MESTAKVRVSLTLDPDVVQTYKGIAYLGNESLSSCINDWLRTTMPALEHLTAQITKVRSQPAQVLNELVLFQEQLQASLGSMGDDLKRLTGGTTGDPGDDAKARLAALAASIREEERIAAIQRPTPHSNTGVKPPLKP